MNPFEPVGLDTDEPVGAVPHEPVSDGPDEPVGVDPDVFVAVDPSVPVEIYISQLGSRLQHSVQGTGLPLSSVGAQG